MKSINYRGTMSPPCSILPIGSQKQFLGISILIILLISAVSFGPLSLRSGTSSPKIQNLTTTPVATGLVKTWGGPASDSGQFVSVDSSGNIYMAGTTYSFGVGQANAFIVKYDSSGNLLWQRTWGGKQYDNPTGMGLDSSGNVYVGGNTRSFNNNNTSQLMFVVKFDSGGNLLLQKAWGASQSGWVGNIYYYPWSASGFTTDSSGNSYFTGTSQFYNSPSQTFWAEVFVAKFGSGGALQWQKMWGNITTGGGIVADSSGNVYVAGSHPQGIYVLKLDSAGTLLWQKTWGGAGCYCGESVALDSSGDVYVGGSTGFRDPAQNFILKLDTSGNVIWQRVFAGLSFASAGFAVDPSGNSYLVGQIYNSGTQNTEGILVKVSMSGGLIWAAAFRGGDNEYATGAASDSGGNLVVVGYVGGPQPYSFRSVNLTLVSSNFAIATPSVSLGTPTAYPFTPPATTTTPSGSSTYSGGGDAVLLTVAASGPMTPPSFTSSIILSIPVQATVTGGSIRISGTITPPINTTVSLTYTRPDSSILVRNVTSTAAGSFTDPFSPDKSGLWQVRASWGGNAQTVGAQSLLQSFQVQDPPSFLATSLPWLILGAVVVGFAIAILVTKPKAPKPV